MVEEEDARDRFLTLLMKEQYHIAFQLKSEISIHKREERGKNAKAMLLRVQVIKEIMIVIRGRRGCRVEANGAVRERSDHWETGTAQHLKRQMILDR